MLLSESAGHPRLAELARSAYDALSSGEVVPYGVLSELIDEASGKAAIRALHQKYSDTAFEAILGPILWEIDRQKPVPPRRRTGSEDSRADPLTAAEWPPARHMAQCSATA